MNGQTGHDLVVLARPLRLDRRAALDLLRRLSGDRGHMLALRRLYAEETGRSAVHRVRDEEVVAHLAERLASGSLVASLLPSPKPGAPPEAGSDAGAAAEAAAAAAAAAAQQAATEPHALHFVFTYPSGEPAAGIDYVLVDPDGNEEPGTSGEDGRLDRQDVPAGTYAVIIKEVESVRFERGRALAGEEVGIRGLASGFAPGTPVKVRLFRELAEMEEDALATIDVELKEDGGVEAVWTIELAESMGGPVALVVAEISLEDGRYWAKTRDPLQVELPSLGRVAWERRTVKDGEEAALVIETLGHPPGTAIRVELFAYRMTGDDASLGSVEGAKVEGPATRVPVQVKYGQEGSGSIPGPGEYYAITTVEAGSRRTARSNLLWAMDSPDQADT